MYKIIYPETGQDVVSIQFATANDASTYWKNRHGTLWIDIEPQQPKDVAAFMQILTGEVVVIRNLEY